MHYFNQRDDVCNVAWSDYAQISLPSVVEEYALEVMIGMYIKLIA